MTQRLVVDTNVVVAGLLTRDPAAPTRRLLDAMLAGRRAFLLSEELLAEYRAVLLRPKIAAAHGLSGEEIDEILVLLAANAAVVDVAPRADGKPHDRAADAHVVALLEAAPDSQLVTGDLALQARVGPRARRPRDLFASRG